MRLLKEHSGRRRKSADRPLSPSRSWRAACARALVRLYPGQWRGRYADELLAILDEHAVSVGTLLDLLVSALLARFDPQFRAQRRLPMVVGRSTAGLTFGGVAMYFLAYFAWFSVDEPLPSELLYGSAPLWRVSERVMNLSVEFVYFGLVAWSLLLGSSAIVQMWRAGRTVFVAATGLAVLVSVLCGLAMLAGSALMPMQSGPPPLAFFAALVIGPVSSLTSVALASAQPGYGMRVRRGSCIIASVIVAAMILALIATVAFAVDLTSNGVPILTAGRQIALYGVTDVPPSGWGYDLQQLPATGSWLGNLCVAIMLMLVATGLSFSALRRTGRTALRI